MAQSLRRVLIMLIMPKSILQLAIGLALDLGLALLASGALQPILCRVDPRDARCLPPWPRRWRVWASPRASCRQGG